MCYFIERTQKCTKLFFNHYLASAIALTQRTASIKELVQVNLKRTECKVIKPKLRKRIKINLFQTDSFSDFICIFAMSFGDFAILLFAALR